MPNELIPMVLFICVAAVLILRPVTKRLGLLLEALAKERLSGVDRRMEDHQVARLVTSIDQLHSRLDLVDDRIHFVERLVESRPAGRLTG